MPAGNVADWCLGMFLNRFRGQVSDDRCKMHYNKMKYGQSISLQSRCHSGHKNNKLEADNSCRSEPIYITDIW